MKLNEDGTRMLCGGLVEDDECMELYVTDRRDWLPAYLTQYLEYEEIACDSFNGEMKASNVLHAFGFDVDDDVVLYVL